MGSASGQWRGKALVRDLKKMKSGTLELEILAQEPSKLRMEAVGSFGVHVASIAMSDDTVQVLLTREKKFVVSNANANSLARLVPIRISPPDLLKVLFDRDLPAKSWKCTDDRATAKRCTDGVVTIRWEKKEEGRRHIQIGSAEASADLVLQEARSKVEFKDDSFVLRAPEGVAVEDLR